MKIVGVIPSRLKSSRVENKPLVDIEGMPMIAHVYNRAKLSEALDDLYVATDSVEIKEVVESYGGKAIITSDKHRNGTERIGEAIKNIDADIVVLINGDEALLNPENIKDSIEGLINSDADASILAIDFKKKNSPSDFKVVTNLKSEVLYISRNDIPSDARNKCDSMLKAYHIMAFKRKTIEAYSKMEKTPLEKIEDHEHLRLIENGYRIKAVQVEAECISVDTYDDLEFVRDKMKNDSIFKKYKDE